MDNATVFIVGIITFLSLAGVGAMAVMVITAVKELRGFYKTHKSQYSRRDFLK